MGAIRIPQIGVRTRCARRQLRAQFTDLAAAISSVARDGAAIASTSPLPCQQLVPLCHKLALDLSLQRETIDEVAAVVVLYGPPRPEHEQARIGSGIRETEQEDRLLSAREQP